MRTTGTENRQLGADRVRIVYGPADSRVITLNDKGEAGESRIYATAELDKILNPPKPEPARVHFDDRAPVPPPGQSAPAAVVPPVQQGATVGGVDWPAPNLDEAADRNDPRLPSLMKGESVQDYRKRVKGGPVDD